MDFGLLMRLVSVRVCVCLKSAARQCACACVRVCVCELSCERAIEMHALTRVPALVRTLSRANLTVARSLARSHASALAQPVKRSHNGRFACACVGCALASLPMLPLSYLFVCACVCVYVIPKPSIWSVSQTGASKCAPATKRTRARANTQTQLARR